MVFVFAYTTAGFVTLLVQCTDIRILWDYSTKATCWAPSTLLVLSYTNFSLNIVTDMIFAVFIPVPMLWNINVTRRTRISLFCVLGLGCFACACAIVRITYLGTYGKYGDWLWDSQYLTTWSVLETNVGIIAASLPSLRPLFKKFLGSIYGTGTKAKAYYGGGSMSRSKKNWQNLSGRNTDKRSSHFARPMGIDEAFHNASSQNALHGWNGDAITKAKESFELVAYAPVRDSAKLSKNPSVSTRVESKRSFEDDVTTPTEASAKGITKTTSMTVTYQIQEARFA
ncbi:hypothetical protein Daus18300_003936 [Diaporthe australafricana]|uniref:Rhodopsin domain-containing protein n=1 Tax=Diaporthe australafricana TaxID=127596 RepID=A0ABR3XD74_9PEZI